MVRTYKKKTKPGTPADLMRTAVKKIVEDGTPLREVATALSIPRGTLQRYVKDARSRRTESIEYQKMKATRQVFTTSQEVMLKEYLITSSKQPPWTDEETNARVSVAVCKTEWGFVILPSGMKTKSLVKIGSVGF